MIIMMECHFNLDKYVITAQVNSSSSFLYYIVDKSCKCSFPDGLMSIIIDPSMIVVVRILSWNGIYIAMPYNYFVAHLLQV